MGQINWKNEDNAPFYVKLGVEGLKTRAEQCGLLQCPDLVELATFLRFHGTEVSNVLEIGAGYGRVAQWLTQNFSNAHLSLVERSEPSAQYLRETFKTHSQVSVLEGDLLTLPLQPKHELALWMWAGCLDFAADQKQAALIKVATALAPQGILAIEIPTTTEEVVKRGSAGNISADLLGYRYNGHIPTQEQLAALGTAAGLVPVTTLRYETSTGLKRSIFILQKPEID